MKRQYDTEMSPAYRVQVTLAQRVYGHIVIKPSLFAGGKLKRRSAYVISDLQHLQWLGHPRNRRQVGLGEVECKKSGEQGSTDRLQHQTVFLQAEKGKALHNYIIVPIV